MAALRPINLRHLPAWLLYALSVIALSVAVLALAGTSIWLEKTHARERTNIATQNVATLLESQISGIFDKVDVALQSVSLHHEEAIRTPGFSREKLDIFLKRQASLFPELESIRVTDKNGLVQAGWGVAAKNEISLADRDYFTLAQDNPNAGLLVDGPLISRISRKWVLIFARALQDENGKFAGIVYATIPTYYLHSLLASADLGPHGAATIRTTDLALVHRNPLPPEASIGNKEVSKQLAQTVKQQPAGGVYLAETAIDGIERSNAYRRLDHYPFYVIVGMATDDYLGGWERNTILIILLAEIVILIAAISARIVYVSSRRQAQATRAVEEEANKLETVLAERNKLNEELELKVKERTAALEKLAQIDPLTELYNRRGMTERIDTLCNQSLREGSYYGVLCIDVDFFKEINDRHGHETGDHALILISNLIRAIIRPYDCAARWGGDEFLILVQNCDEETLRSIGERICHAADSSRELLDAEGKPIHLSLSIGGIMAGYQETDYILRKADEALYAAKASGRNSLHLSQHQPS